MPAPQIYTFHDILEHLRGTVRGGSDTHSENAFLSAVRAAYRELAMYSNWSCMWRPWWVSLEAAYSTGTVAFDFTGGTYERQLTLTSGTWPTNAVYFMVRIAGVNYKIEDRKSDTVVTLASDSNPGADVASTTYTAFRSEYTLPHDFRKISLPIPNMLGGMRQVSPEEFYSRERLGWTTGDPNVWTIVGDQNLYGSLAILVYPAPSADRTLGFMYQRWGRGLKISGEAVADSVGTVTTDGTATVAGTLTTVNPAHVGSIVRFGDATNAPTSYDGQYPPADERTIIARASATSFTVDAAVAAMSAVKYRISDPIDFDQGLFNVLLRNCEKQLASRQRDYQVVNIINGAWKEELALARANDHRFAGDSVSGENYGVPGWPAGITPPIEARLAD